MVRRFPATLFFTTAGLLIWAADFLFTYVFAALACARGFAATKLYGIGVVPLASGIATIIALAATGAIVLIAIAWNGLPALLVRRVC